MAFLSPSAPLVTGAALRRAASRPLLPLVFTPALALAWTSLFRLVDVLSTLRLAVVPTVSRLHGDWGGDGGRWNRWGVPWWWHPPAV